MEDRITKKIEVTISKCKIRNLPQNRCPTNTRWLVVREIQTLQLLLLRLRHHYLISSSIFAWASRSNGSAEKRRILSCSLLARSCCCSTRTLENFSRSPLSRASARGGLRSFSKDSSWGLASNMSRSKAGLSKPWGDEAISPGDEWDCCAPGGCRCRELDVPGTAILRKSIRGKSVGENRFSLLQMTP